MKYPLSFYLAFMTLLLIPAYVVRFPIGPLPSTLLEVLIFATALIWTLEIWLDKEIKTLPGRVRSPVFVPGLALIVIALIEVFVGPDIRAGLGLWRAYFVEPFILGIVILDQVRRGFGKPLVFALIGSGVWVSLIAIGQASGLFIDINERSADPIRLGRAVAVYNTPNAVALYLGPLAALAAVLVWRSIPGLILSVALFLVAILDSKSKGGLLGLGAGLGAAFLGGILPRVSVRLAKLFWKAVAVVPMVLLLALIGILVNISSLAPDIKPAEGRVIEDTGVLRLCLWEGTGNILSNNPLFGTGVGGFSQAYGGSSTCYAETHLYPHNIFLNFWTELGFLGMLTFIYILYKILLSLNKVADGVLALGLAAAFVYMIAHGLVDVPYFKNDLAAQFWVLAAFAIAASEAKLSFKKS
jgi:O-antigen ligase